MDYIIGEDEKGKFVKFEKNGVQATIRFDATNAPEAMSVTKWILGSVFERVEKNRLCKGDEEQNEASLLSIPRIYKGASGS